MAVPKAISDPFLYKLLGGAAGFMGIILALYAWHFEDSRISTCKAVITDFAAPVPSTIQLAFQISWLPICTALLMVVTGAAPVMRPHRHLLAVTVVLSLVTMGLLMLEDSAIYNTFFNLTRSISGS